MWRIVSQSVPICEYKSEKSVDLSTVHTGRPTLRVHSMPKQRGTMEADDTNSYYQPMNYTWSGIYSNACYSLERFTLACMT